MSGMRHLPCGHGVRWTLAAPFALLTLLLAAPLHAEVVAEPGGEGPNIHLQRFGNPAIETLTEQATVGTGDLLYCEEEGRTLALTADEQNSGDVKSPFRLYVFADQETLVLHLIEGDLVVRTDGATGALVGDVLIGAEGTEFYVRRRTYADQTEPQVSCAVFEGAVRMKAPRTAAVRIDSGRSWDWRAQRVADEIPTEMIERSARILAQPLVDRIRKTGGTAEAVERDVSNAQKSYEAVLKEPRNTVRRAELLTLQMEKGVAERTSYDVWRLKKIAEEATEETAENEAVKARVDELSRAYEEKVRASREADRRKKSLGLVEKLAHLDPGADISRRRALALRDVGKRTDAAEAALVAIEQNIAEPILDESALRTLWLLVGAGWSRSLRSQRDPITREGIAEALTKARERMESSPSIVNRLDLALLTRISGDRTRARAHASRILAARPQLRPWMLRILKALAVD